MLSMRRVFRNLCCFFLYACAEECSALAGGFNKIRTVVVTVKHRWNPNGVLRQKKDLRSSTSRGKTARDIIMRPGYRRCEML